MRPIDIKAGDSYYARYAPTWVYRVNVITDKGTDLHRKEPWVNYTVRTGPLSGTRTECSLSDFAMRVSRPALSRGRVDVSLAREEEG